MMKTKMVLDKLAREDPRMIIKEETSNANTVKRPTYLILLYILT